jgi:beta-galactosidase GanA
MELAQKHQLDVIIQFGGMFRNYCGNSIPQWWTESTCPDFTPYRRKVDTFMAKVVERYATHPSLLGWMLWNEPETDNCKCEHTIAAYRKWLQEKYGTLEVLNRTWSTNQTLNFGSWDEVIGGGSKIANADWLFFKQQRLAKLMKSIDGIVKENDPYGHFTTSNIVNHFTALNGPHSAAEFGDDVGAIATSMDVMGFSFYHVEHSFDMVDYPEMQHAYKQSRFRSVSQTPNRRTYVLETGAGPDMAQLTEKERTRFHWQMVGHNVKCILLRSR